MPPRFVFLSCAFFGIFSASAGFLCAFLVFLAPADLVLFFSFSLMLYGFSVLTDTLGASLDLAVLADPARFEETTSLVFDGARLPRRSSPSSCSLCAPYFFLDFSFCDLSAPGGPPPLPPRVARRREHASSPRIG